MKRIESVQDFIDIFPYGVSELRRVYRKYLATALAISICFHLVAVGSYFLVRSLARGEEPTGRVVRIVKYTELGPPPSITGQAPPAVAVSVAIARPKIGVPVPVPDAKISKEITIPTQEELGQIAQPTIGTGTGDSLMVTGLPGGAGDEPGIDENVAVQVPPVAIVQVRPVYPKAARASGLTGTVLVKALVDKEGKVKRAVPLKGPDIFYDAAVAAAMKWVFRPAIQKDEPVAVWVMIPFNFNLED
jgi:periplasmic protein TonB